MTTAPAPYESPAKTEMRTRCEVAVDQAGHQLVTAPRAVDLPGASIQGRLRGDLQSLDDEGVLYCYYVRPVVDDLLPQWLVDFGQHVRRAAETKLIVVYYEASAELEQSCIAAGVGLVVLTEDNRFEQIVNFDDVQPESVAKEIAERVKELRRELDRKLDVQRTSLTSRIADVNELTQGMTEEMIANFLSNLETRLKRVDDWAYDVSKRLDGLAADFTETDFEHVKAAIESGSQSDGEPE